MLPLTMASQVFTSTLKTLMVLRFILCSLNGKHANNILNPVVMFGIFLWDMVLYCY